jgi:hypothetical protein
MWECNETKCEGDDPIVGSYTSVGNKLCMKKLERMQHQEEMTNRWM